MSKIFLVLNSQNPCKLYFYYYLSLLYFYFVNGYNLLRLFVPNIRHFSNDSNTVDLAYDLYDDYNSQNALVIAHGLFGSKQNWRSVAKRINECSKQKVSFKNLNIINKIIVLIFSVFKIYTVDLRNHGDTLPYVSNMTYVDMAKDLKKFIQVVVKNRDQVNKVTLLGHSMGGKTAMTVSLNEVIKV